MAVWPGAAADLAILSDNVLNIAAEKLPSVRSLLTMVDGVVIFEEGEASFGDRAQRRAAC